MRKLLEVQAARDELGAKSTELQNTTAFQLELLATIDDAAKRIAGELSDQWDQLKGIAESSREIQTRLDDIRDQLQSLVKATNQIGG